MAPTTMENPLPGTEKGAINDTRGSNADPAAEKRLLRKCDLHVLPPLFVLFLLAFLDRANIGRTPQLKTVKYLAKTNERQATRRSRALRLT
jgi:hypothetical protein